MLIMTVAISGNGQMKVLLQYYFASVCAYEEAC